MPKNKIYISTIVKEYNVDVLFLQGLAEIGRLEMFEDKEDSYIDADELVSLEKMIRINQDLNINIEGIDSVLYLLERVEELQELVSKLSEKLNVLDDDWFESL